MKKRIVAFLVCAAMIGSLLAGCGNGEKGNTSDSTVENVSGTSEQGEKDDSTASGESKGTIGWIMINLTNSFYVSAVEAAQKAADELGYELIVRDCGGSLETEIDMIENFIEMDVDVICADFVNAEGLADACKKADDAGIKMISLFNSIDTGYNYSVA